jgi:hypothetical protein
MNMTPAELESRLAAYLAVRQAMGYAMRAERTLLADFVKFLVHRGEINPIRAQAALDWASQSAHKHGSSGTASRLVMARRFLLHLRVSYPDTEIPAHGLVAAARRPAPFLCSPTIRLSGLSQRPAKQVLKAPCGRILSPLYWACLRVQDYAWAKPCA